MVNEQPTLRTWWPRCIFVIIIVIILVIIWCRFLPFPCPLCPPAPVPPDDKAAAQIVIDDSRAATWMVSSNEYLDTEAMNKGDKPLCSTGGSSVGSCTTPYTSNPVHGVMFQFGDLHGTDNTWTPSLDRIEIYQANDPADYDLGNPETYTVETLKYGMFDWLNVSPFEDCIIDAYHAYALFINGVVGLECDSTIWDKCRRNRSLHSSLRSTGGLMTYWSGNNGYGVQAERASGSSHPSYTFDLNDPVHVDRWNAGCFEIRYDNVVQILIIYDVTGSTPGSIFDDPPTDGGVHTFP